jgi:hypothetical protein
MLDRIPVARFLLAAILLCCGANSTRESRCFGGEDDILAQLERAATQATADTYELKYKMRAGSTLRYRVEHLASVETTIGGNTQEQKSRSISTKAWKFLELDPTSGLRFEHVIEDVDMWQTSTGRQDVTYNSRQDRQPPAEYEHVAESLGKPLATVTMDVHGKVLDRDVAAKHPDWGFGGLVMPLPEGKVAIGHTWTVPHLIHARREDRTVQQIKTRLRYRLERVQTGVATISIKSEVLTPISDQRIKSQIVQQLSNGEIKFDIDAGHVLSKQLDWDETVIGFNGNDSNMKYLARFTETLLKPDEVARHQELTDDVK